MALPYTDQQTKIFHYVGIEGCKNTYSAAITGLVPVAAATDLLTIIGATDKSIRVRKIGISGVAGTAGVFAVLAIKRSTAGSGGTSSTLTAVPLDALSPAASATVKAFTANPTVGTIIAAIRSGRLGLPAVTESNTKLLEFIFDGKPVTLNSATEQLAINLNGATISSGLLDVYIEWTEE